MTPLSDMIARAELVSKNNGLKHIVLAEGLDPRIINAAVRAVTSKIAKITLLGPQGEIRALARAAGDRQDLINIMDPVDITDPKNALKANLYGGIYLSLRQHKDIDTYAADLAARNPLNFANIMVHNGDADGSIAGARHTTGEVVRSALQIIGMPPNSDPDSASDSEPNSDSDSDSYSDSGQNSKWFPASF